MRLQQQCIQGNQVVLDKCLERCVRGFHAVAIRIQDDGCAFVAAALQARQPSEDLGADIASDELPSIQ